MSRSLSLRAISLGYFTDMATTQIFAVALAIVLLDPGSGSTCLAQRIDPHLVDWMGIAWGMFFTMLGGFVAARRAPALPYIHASCSGFLSLVTCLNLYGLCPTGIDLSLYHGGLWLTVPAAMLGARLARLWRD